MNNTLNPYFSNRIHNYDFKPTDKVYVPTVDMSWGNDTIKILGSIAYRTIEDAKFDIWNKNPNAEMKEMTVKDFLKKRLNKYHSINEFHKLKEFTEKYEEKYGIILGVINE